MVSQFATGSMFFDDGSWYDWDVVSDISSMRWIRPGETAEINFSLSAENVPAGTYRECFRLQTKPERIDASWDSYQLVNPIEVEGSSFCMGITVLPAELAREATAMEEIKDEELPGRLYWESKMK